MFNERKSLNLYTSPESYNNSRPDIVLNDVSIDSIKDGILIVKDDTGYTHILNVDKFVAIVY